MKEIIFEVYRIQYGWLCFSPFGTIYAISQPIMVATLIELAEKNRQEAKVDFIIPPPDEGYPGGPELSTA